MTRITRQRADEITGKALLCAVDLDWLHNRRTGRFDIYAGPRRVGSIHHFDEVEELLERLDLLTLHPETEEAACSAPSASRA